MVPTEQYRCLYGTIRLKIMPNMSYCRFENTVNDMRDCINAIEDGECDELSSYEIRALKQFKRMGDEINNLDIDIDLIIERYEFADPK